MNINLVPNCIVKYKSRQTFYILIDLDLDGKTASIKSCNGKIYKVKNIEKLEIVNEISMYDFYNKTWYKTIENFENEIWKEIFFLKGIFASNEGRIKSNRSTQREVLLQMVQNCNGHFFIKVGKNSDGTGAKRFCNVAHLIAIAFIPNPQKFKYVLFRDNNPDNLCAENLEWSATGVFQNIPENRYRSRENVIETFECNNYERYGGPTDGFGGRIDDDFIDDVLGGIPDAIWNII